MRAVLCGYYGMGNAGDEALLASLLQMLPPQVTPIVLSGNPKQTQQCYGVESCDRWSPLAVFTALRHSDALIWGGGSLMQDATSRLSPWYYGGLMKLAQWMGLKTIAWAQGIGPLTRPMTTRLAKHIFQACTRVSVRDRGSAALLDTWQIPYVLAPDPVWALEAISVLDLWDLPEPRVAVNLRSHPDLTPIRLNCLIQALVEFQTITQVYLLLLPFQSSQDLAIAQAIKPHLPGPNKIILLEDPLKLKGVFQIVEMTIAMRLHGLIMAAAEGSRCFALSYDPKVTQLMTSLELPGCQVIDIAIDPEPICRAWLDVYSKGSSLSIDRIQALATQASAHQDILRETFLTPQLQNNR